LEEDEQINAIKNRVPNYSNDWRTSTNNDRAVTPPPEANWELREKAAAAVWATSVVAPSREDLLAHLALLTAHRKGKAGGLGQGLSPPPTTSPSGQPSRRRITSRARVSADTAATDTNPQWSAINRAQQETARLRNQFEDLNKEIQSMKQRTSLSPKTVKLNGRIGTHSHTASHTLNSNTA